MGDRLFWWQLYEQVNVVNLHIELLDLPPVHLCALAKELVQPPRKWASQHSFAILWYPHQVIHEAVGRVSPRAILFHGFKHAIGVYASASACSTLVVPFIPGLESPGFSDGGINRQDYLCRKRAIIVIICNR